MTKLGIDISSYQDSSVSYLKTKKKQGAQFLLVKLTENTNYLNPKAGAQIANGFKVFNTVGVYHFFHGRGTAEAQYFLAWVKKMGLDKSTVLAIDVEYNGLPTYTTTQVNIFLRYLIARGYKHVITYGSGSWFNVGRINHSALTADRAIWVAAYQTDRPGVVDADAWQFTDNFHGVDASYDFTGKLSGTKTKAKPTKAAYWSDSGLFEVTAKVIYAYTSTDFKTKRRVHLAKGSTFYGDAVKYGSVYRIKTKVGYFTANKKMVSLKHKK